MNKKPPELHLIDGTIPRREMPTMLPSSIKQRVPKAEWMDNPDAWDKEKFIEETATFLYEVYGIGSNQDKHALTMLADNIETYVNCNRYIKKNNLIINQNNNQTKGPNPAVSMRAKTTTLIIQLMNELGLTPRSRLSAGKIEDNSPIGKLMRGPAF